MTTASEPFNLIVHPNFEVTMKNSMPRVLSLFGVLAILTCGEKKNDSGQPSGSSGGQSNIYTTLKLKTGTGLSNSTTSNCHVQASQASGAADGLCMTPDNVTMWASTISLFKINSSGQSYARILGGGSGLGKSGFLEGALFNLSAAGTLKGEDTLWEVYKDQPEFDSLSVSAAYLRVAFTIKEQAWELLVPFIDQPVQDIPGIVECLDSPALANVKLNANVLSDLSFKKGDFLFCKKTGTTCNFSDFKWFDKTSQTLTSSRPSNPKRFAYADNLEVKCKSPSANGNPPDLDFRTHDFFFTLTSKVKVYGDFSHGANSGINPGAGVPYGISEADWNAYTENGATQKSPFFIYTIDDGGKKQIGNRLNVKLSFDFSDWLVLDGIRDLSSSTEAQILNSLTTKDLFMRDSLAKGQEFTPNQKVTVDLSVANSTLAEIYTSTAPGTQPTSLAE